MLCALRVKRSKLGLRQAKANQRVKVFVSHSSVDTWVAKQIAGAIREAGAEVFLDAFDLKKGDDFNDRIQDEAARCSELVVLLTPWAMKSKYVWVEVGAFLGRKKRIVAVLHGVPLKDVSGMDTAFLAGTVKININQLDEYFAELEERR